MKKELMAVLVTVVGGVAVYWLTTGLQERKNEAELANQRAQEQQRADAEQRAREDEELAARPQMSQLEMDVNRDGSDYKDFVAANIEECLNACAEETQCRAITFTKSSRQCWMKSGVPLRTNDASYISAVKIGE